MIPPECFLDIYQLSERGWTDSLVSKYLGDEDERWPVNHFANFSGKRVWFLGRVEMIENTAHFKCDLEMSLKRRKLDTTKIDEMEACRQSTAGMVEKISPDDLASDLVLVRRLAELRATLAGSNHNKVSNRQA